MSTVVQMPSPSKRPQSSQSSSPSPSASSSPSASPMPVHCVGVTTRSTTSSLSSLSSASSSSLHLPATILALVDPPAPCKRTVVWYIDGVGTFCHVCQESYLATNWRKIEITAIHRLSDREEDFFKS